MRRLTPEDVGNIWLGFGMLGVMSAAAFRVHYRGIDELLGTVLPLCLGCFGVVFVWKAVCRLTC